MPRVNPLRSLANERNVAARVQRERERLGMSYEGLAHRMAGAGAPIQPTAIYKIEKGDPPRRITVDELVGFARVFDIPVEELLTPPEEMVSREARQLLNAFGRAGEALQTAVQDMRDVLGRLAVISPDLSREYTRQLWAELPTRFEEAIKGETRDARTWLTEVFEKPPDPVWRAITRLLEEIYKDARRTARHAQH